MGRTKTPIKVDGPTGRFAELLRDARLDAGGPTYRAMAERANWSHNALSQADRGDRIPTWECTCAYLFGLGINGKAIETTWRERWRTAHRELDLAKKKELRGI